MVRVARLLLAIVLFPVVLGCAGMQTPADPSPHQYYRPGRGAL